MTHIVLDLASLDGSMLPLVGGKAANLGELIRAGLPVPLGFCVTTEAYAQVAASATMNFDSAGSAARMREALMGVRMPAPVAAAITAAYHRLGDCTPVAVRSSATAEDLPHASFAGQQDTYLNIIGAAAVLDAVQRCWASLWTDRAVVYRTTNGIDHGAVRLAVVIQRMVNAEMAGVLFTANPITGRRRQAVIDASPGLGEAVVSGSVNPDHFVVNTGTGEIVERKLGDKRFEVLALPEGGTRHLENAAGDDRACLTDRQIVSLAALGDQVEAHFGAPQDTEWAIDGNGAIWLTQARPITTLFPLPANQAAGRVYFCFSVAQGLYRPLTPMGLAASRALASAFARLLGIHADDPLAGPPAYAEAGQRVFVDVTSTLQGSVGRLLLPRVLDVMEARSSAMLRNLLDDPSLPVARRTWFSFARRVLRISARYAVPMRVAQALAWPRAAHERIARIGEELSRRLAGRAKAGATERLDFVERTLSNELVHLAPTILPLAAAGLAMLGLAAKLLGDAARPGDLQTVLRGLPHNVTTEMDLDLWKLAQSIRPEKSVACMMHEVPAAELARRFHEKVLPDRLQSGVTGFLAQYGHRGVAEIDIGIPRWSDDPTHIFGVLANYLRLEDPEMAPDAVFARGASDAEAMIETLVNRARVRGPLRARLVRFALDRARQLAGLREIPKYYLVTGLAAMRRELAAIGEELTAQGAINTAADVFFLDFPNVRAALKGSGVRNLISERRESYEAELRRRHVPSVLLSDGTEPESAPARALDANCLAGTPASAGKVTGRARVVLDPVGAQLEPGEILVVPSTDPGWTPLFLTAGGLIMEMGGANSHGAVVAREYGIPAVVGVAGATLRIATGQGVTMDGAAGTISMAGATS